MFPKAKRGAGRKYGNSTGSLCRLNHSHRSKLESAVCGILQLRLLAKEFDILEVEQHVKICGVPGHLCDHSMKIEYIADFKCSAKDGQVLFFVEAKGYPNEKWPMKRRLWMHNRPEKLEIWKGTHTRPYLDEVLNG